MPGKLPKLAFCFALLAMQLAGQEAVRYELRFPNAAHHEAEVRATFSGVRDRVLEAAEFIPLEQLGTTDDCGFSPFSDDTSTTRDTAFEKIRSRVLGTRLAEQALA